MRRVVAAAPGPSWRGRGRRRRAPSCHRLSSAAKATCQSSGPAWVPDDQQSARKPPGSSQPWTRPATRSRGSRWKALPMTASQKWPGGASSSSALATTGRMRAPIAGGGLGRGHLDHVPLLVNGPDLRERGAQRERKLPGAASQVEQPSPPGRLRPAHQVGDQRVRVREPEPVVVLRRAPVKVGRERHFVAHDRQHSTAVSRSALPETAEFALARAGAQRRSDRFPAFAGQLPPRAPPMRPRGARGSQRASRAAPAKAARSRRSAPVSGRASRRSTP